MNFFLGANSYRGFFSLFESYLRQISPERVYILKGGAGCGKSTLMKTLADAAEKQGLTADRIFCSGDMDSLDGIRIVERGTVLLDGTAPHVIEPPQVGEKGFYLDLSRFYSAGICGLPAKEREYREHYRNAYKWLQAAGAAGSIHTLTEDDRQRLLKRAKHWVSRRLPFFAQEAHTLDLFTEAFTGSGIMKKSDYTHNGNMLHVGLLGICGSEAVFLAEIYRLAAERGCNIICCHDPLEPERLSGIVFPDMQLCLISGQGDRNLDLKKNISVLRSTESWSLYYDVELQRRTLLRNAERELYLAKLSHDALEEAVHPFIDYPGISDFTDSLLHRIL